MTDQINKYPRTHHIEGSRFQPGDEDLNNIPFQIIAGQNLVIEEKLDGANSAISFTHEGELRLQSRGHFLLGGNAERHFNLFKRWANTHATTLLEMLGCRYILYGEWLYAKHTIFYDHLPHYFLEFDILDKDTGQFLDTVRRRTLIDGRPIVSVPVLYTGALTAQKQLAKLVCASNFIQPGHLTKLRQACEEKRLDVARAMRETDLSIDMEGLYIKVEADGVVKERYKFVRASFLTTVLNSNSHWQSRPIIANQLRPAVDLFSDH